MLRLVLVFLPSSSLAFWLAGVSAISVSDPVGGAGNALWYDGVEPCKSAGLTEGLEGLVLVEAANWSGSSPQENLEGLSSWQGWRAALAGRGVGYGTKSLWCMCPWSGSPGVSEDHCV